jgi:hypothetical protein
LWKSSCAPSCLPLSWTEPATSSYTFPLSLLRPSNWKLIMYCHCHLFPYIAWNCYHRYHRQFFSDWIIYDLQCLSPFGLL